MQAAVKRILETVYDTICCEIMFIDMVSNYNYLLLKFKFDDQP